MKHTIKLLLLATVVVCFAACGTSRKATKGSGTENAGKAEATAEAYKERLSPTSRRRSTSRPARQ